MHHLKGLNRCHRIISAFDGKPHKGTEAKAGQNKPRESRRVNLFTRFPAFLEAKGL